MNRRTVAVALAGVAAFLNLYTPQAILPLLAEVFAMDAAATGRVVTASLVAVALVAPVAGAVSDRLGRKRLISGACLLLALPTLLLATSQSLQAMMAWRFLQGLLLPFIFAVTVAYIGEEADGPDGIRLTGVFGIGSIIGGFGGRLVAGVAAELAGWRAGFICIGLFTLGAGVAIAMLLPAEQRFRPQTGGVRGMAATWAGHLRNPRLLATCGIGFGMLFTNVAAYTFVNLYLAAPPFGLSPAQLGFVFAVYLVGVGTTAMATAMAVRIGRRATLALAAALAASGLVLTLVVRLEAVIAGLALMSGGLLVVQTLALGFIGAIVPQGRSAAVGLYVTIYYIGGALGGVVPAVAWQAAGWGGVVALLLPVLAAMTGLALMFWRPATGR